MSEVVRFESGRPTGSAQRALPTLGWISCVGFGVGAVFAALGWLPPAPAFLGVIGGYIVWALSAAIGVLALGVDSSDRFAWAGVIANVAPWGYAVYLLSKLQC